MQFELLGKHHDRHAFDCGNDHINQYLKTMTNQHHQKGSAKVHVLADGKAIVRFYTLTNISIQLDLKGYPPSTPAVIIGRIGVDLY